MELNQQQVESLVKLMIMAEYQDNKLSFIESRDFKNRIVSFSWNSPVGMSIFISTAIAEIRNAASDEALKAEFLKEQSEAFDTSESKQFALDQISDLIESDGVKLEESSFLLQLRNCLNI